jgi:hypothetical protein
VAFVWKKSTLFRWACFSYCERDWPGADWLSYHTPVRFTLLDLMRRTGHHDYAILMANDLRKSGEL